MSTLILALALLQPRPPAVIGECDPRDTGAEWTAEQRREVRLRIRAACQALGASPIVCAYADAVAVRESSGRAGVWHTLGENELGLGAMGLSLRWHAGKWPGEADPDFCRPEVSLLVAHAIWWRAVTRYQARTLVEVQAIYAGRWRCWQEGERRVCRADPSHRGTRGICSRLKRRGFDCFHPIEPADLGRKHRRHERAELADQLAAAWRIDAA